MPCGSKSTAFAACSTLGGLIQNKQVGEQVQFMVHRGSQTLTLTATLEERPGNL